MRKRHETDIIEANGLTEADKVRLMLWGDPKLGVKGLKGRLERVDKLLWSLIVFDALVFLVMAGHIGLAVDPQGGIVGAIIRGLFGGG